MFSKIILTITQGKIPGRQYIFDSRTTCILGRHSDCYPQLPDDKEHRTISRYHCLLDINPPDIRVRDFGSKNGTYVNNKKIGQRQSNQTPEEAGKLTFPEYDLQSGDEIQLGNTVFEVLIESEAVKFPPLPSTFHINSHPEQEPNFLEIIKRWLGLANNGEQKFIAIRGYSIVKLLGKGGCGEVYLAQHQMSGKFVALKVMLPEVAANERAVQMFLRETENTKALRHPHVVQLLDYGYSDDIFFFTMEYCNCSSVDNWMEKEGGRLPVDISVSIILQILDGLEYAHHAEIPYVKLADGTVGQGRGVVHRDLKPSNIFLSYIDGKIIAKIGDYGLSKAFDLAGLSGQTLTGNASGTLAFMSRQQLLDFKHAKPEVDVWATAACLYNMLTGDFPRDFNKDIFLAVLENDPVPIQQRDAKIPQKLAKVIDLALVEKPEIYFKSTSDFKKALLGVI